MDDRLQAQLTRNQKDWIYSFVMEHYCEQFNKVKGAKPNSKLQLIVGYEHGSLRVVAMRCAYCKKEEQIKDTQSW